MRICRTAMTGNFTHVQDRLLDIFVDQSPSLAQVTRHVDQSARPSGDTHRHPSH